MADFLTNLWDSIFTPGATPTLLLATNFAFAALQLTLLALLIATYSLHFAILSVLCGSLWAAINWFVAELKAVQQEEEADRIRERQRGKVQGRKDETPTALKQSGDVTETIGTASASGLKPPAGDVRQRRMMGSEQSGDISTDSEWEKVEDE
ncbi:hypothetical protein H2203_007512 [Taxawa tesnikishii (nom. ined.)]|nr:hypothetical protein H2203_007512 [Dothideales sp. JES 119]